ncbi:putative membrane protein [Pseudoduganella flava]|uniref:DUF2269 family protein n=1 Tax=Pseudoduganella flava TaxID=871742 RepID=A0A562PGJ4_9BURK|nr:DUF2269 domain-containing protein [Pseudoduganella flava]QGZ40350.1 DUF2269 family protein [Pseudoduganella flava]TWI43539.1 putative membrane protein [Pseudoduganella flava]
MEYVIVKWLHILSSTFLFGTGIGSAWYLLFAVISRNVAAIAVVTRIVVMADWIFTGLTMIAQPATGFYLVHLAGFPLHSKWIMWSITLFVIAACCWFPVVWLQMRLRDTAAAAAAEGTPLPPAFWRYFKRWIVLGIPAFFAFLAVFYLMVAKPM